MTFERRTPITADERGDPTGRGYRETPIVDVHGIHSPEVIATGSGKAYVLRDGV